MKKLSNEELIERFNKIHNNKFDYSLMNYNDINHKIKIICPIHGEFEQTVKNHLKVMTALNASKEKNQKLQKNL